jgi:hypothetical protein
MNPAQLIVADQSDGQLYRVPYEVDGDGVTFGAADPLESYADVAAGRETGPVVAYASAEESRAVMNDDDWRVEYDVGVPDLDGEALAAADDAAAGYGGFRLTPDQVTSLVDAAIASGRVSPADRDEWLVACAAGGEQGGTAIAALTGGETDPAAADDLYAALYPEQRPAPHGWEPDRLVQHDARVSYLRAAAPGLDGLDEGDEGDELPGHEPVTGHGAMHVEHEHEHADYGGGTHTHPHVHRGDGQHRPGAGHGHGPVAGPTAASAGIAARQAEQAAAGPGFAYDSDDELYERLFGRQP